MPRPGLTAILGAALLVGSLAVMHDGPSLERPAMRTPTRGRTASHLSLAPSQASSPAASVSSPAPQTGESLHLKATGRVFGCVTGIDGSPRAADVTFLGKSDPGRSPVRVKSGSDGRYSAELAVGDWVGVAQTAEESSLYGVDVIVEGGDEIDLGALILFQGDILCGYVTDPDLRPIGGATVIALQNGMPAGAVAWTTDAGEYRLPVSYCTDSVQARARGFASASCLIQGEQHRFDLRLRPASRATGRVASLSGAPVAGAGVKAQYQGEAYVRPYPDQRHATADSDGRFSLDDLEPERWWVTAVAEGFVSEGLDFDGAAPRELEFRLGGAGAVEGRIVGSDLGAREPDVTIFHGPRPDGTDGGACHARVEKDGTFRTGNVLPGRCVARLMGAGIGNILSGEFDVVEGRTTSGVEFVLGRGATVRGVVRSVDTGLPLGGAAGNWWKRIGGIRFGDGFRADEQGRFEVSNLLAGTIEFRFEDGWHLPEDFTLELPGTGTVVRDVHLSDGLHLTLRVLVDGAPARKPSISLVSAEGRDRAAVREVGDASFETQALSEGEWMITVEAPHSDDRLRRAWTVETGSGPSTTMELRLRSAPLLRGTVRRGGLIATGGEVLFVGLGALVGTWFPAEVSGDGGYRVDGLEPGEYGVIARDEFALERDPLTGARRVVVGAAAPRLRVGDGEAEQHADVDLP